MEVKMPKFAQRVRELRTERSLTQREMGALLGKTDRHYQAIEAGHVNVPALTLEKLADFLKSVRIIYWAGMTGASHRGQGTLEAQPKVRVAQARAVDRSRFR